MADPYSAIISEAIVEKYFGSENPIGKPITYRGTLDFKVTGILKNTPKNSIFNLDFIVPFETFDKIDSRFDLNSWDANSFHTYFLLRDDINIQDLENKFPVLIEKYLGEEIAKRGFVIFQPLTKVHLQGLRMKLILLFGSIAILIMVIACINYKNLSTARLVQRMKEIGIRKVVGANRSQLIRQFLGESIIFTLLAFIFAIIVVLIVLPIFNKFTETDLTFNLLKNRPFLLWLFGLILFVGIFSGSFPALTITAFSPTSIFTRKFSGLKGSRLRNILVVLQFTDWKRIKTLHWRQDGKNYRCRERFSHVVAASYH